MKETLKDVIKTAHSTGTLYLATSGADGTPHIASARQISLREDGRIVLREWFCPNTVRNLDGNSKISLVIYDSGHDTGFQVQGEVEAIQETAMMDGFSPESLPPIPQEERELIIRPGEILAFSQGPHTDRAL